MIDVFTLDIDVLLPYFLALVMFKKFGDYEPFCTSLGAPLNYGVLQQGHEDKLFTMPRRHT